MTLQRNPKSKIQNPKSNNSGFTLIEVLVVLIIAGAGISLVGPRLFAAYDSIKASVEEQKLIDVLEAVRMKAFLRQVPYTIQLENNTLQVKNEDARLEFKFIHFPHASITFNGNGFTDTNKINYLIREKNKVLDVS